MKNARQVVLGMAIALAAFGQASAQDWPTRSGPNTVAVAVAALSGSCAGGRTPPGGVEASTSAPGVSPVVPAGTTPVASAACANAAPHAAQWPAETVAGRPQPGQTIAKL